MPIDLNQFVRLRILDEIKKRFQMCIYEAIRFAAEFYIGRCPPAQYRDGLSENGDLQIGYKILRVRRFELELRFGKISACEYHHAIRIANIERFGGA